MQQIPDELEFFNIMTGLIFSIGIVLIVIALPLGLVTRLIFKIIIKKRQYLTQYHAPYNLDSAQIGYIKYRTIKPYIFFSTIYDLTLKSHKPNFNPSGLNSYELIAYNYLLMIIKNKDTIRNIDDLPEFRESYMKYAMIAENDFLSKGFVRYRNYKPGVVFIGIVLLFINLITIIKLFSLGINDNNINYPDITNFILDYIFISNFLTIVIATCILLVFKGSSGDVTIVFKKVNNHTLSDWDLIRGYYLYLQTVELSRIRYDIKHSDKITNTEDFANIVSLGLINRSNSIKLWEKVYRSKGTNKA